MKEPTSLKREIIGTDEVGEVDQPEEKEDYLDATDDGEPSEETHGATDEAQLGLRLDLLVPLYVVEGGRVKIDLNQLKS